MSSIQKNIKMHHFHALSAIKNSSTPVFLCQECCTFKISVTLLPLLPLHDNSFPNFLSSPLVAILPHLLTKTPVSLKWFFFSKKHPSPTHSPSFQFDCLSLLECYNQGEVVSYFSIHSGCWSCLKKKKASERLQGHRTERWVLINPTTSKNTRKAIWLTPLHIMEKPPLINSNCKPMQFMTSAARITNHGTNSVGGFLQ